MQESELLDLLVQISIASPTFSLVTVLGLLTFLSITLIFLRKASKQKSIEKKLATHHSNRQISVMSASNPTMHSSVLNMNLNELLDIEEALLALRELYHRKLITAEVYIDESMKHSERIRA